MPNDNWKFEQSCLDRGFRLVAGVDEVGMGCLAGPVVAAAVILNSSKIPPEINDSKKLSPKKREALDPLIRESALAWAIGIAEVDEIDRLNIYHAAKLAMVRAVRGLQTAPDFLLVDGRGKLDIEIPYEMIVKGDQLSVSIGAASILAKVYRDNLMQQFDGTYPGYGFASHKGYGSVLHRQQLQAQGTTPIHRKSFSWTPV